MITSAIFVSSMCMLVVLICVLQECTFLVPYRQLIFSQYFHSIAAFASLLFLNLFAFFHLLIRTLFLKDTGQKLAHLEKELRNGGAVSAELADRLEE